MPALKAVLFFLGFIAVAQAPMPSHAGLPMRYHIVRAAAPSQKVRNCTEHFFDNYVDHFSYGKAIIGEGTETFKQRYIICSPYKWKQGNPVYFYVGNEANVELYVNNTGLMWESSEEFGALLVFSEHRYFGKSQMPFEIKQNGSYMPSRMNYLSVDQAIADHANLIFHLKRTKCSESPFIGFGGSYGGMLAYWLSLKYQTALDGVIAASAPVFEFLGQSPEYDSGSFAARITRDTLPEFGGMHECADRIRQSWEVLFNMSKSSRGRSKLSQSFHLCEELENESDVLKLANWAQSSFDYLAMGSYPYPSSYMLNGDGFLPAFPMNVACRNMMEDFSNPMVGLRNAVSLFFNATGEKPCFDLNIFGNEETSEVSNLWNYLSCTSLTQPMKRDGIRDMFWNQPFNFTEYISQCKKQWKVTPRPLNPEFDFGGWENLFRSSRNIIFTNGELDPWIGGGVTSVPKNDRSVYAYVIPMVGHHIDLMWSHPEDPIHVRKVRKFEVNAIRKWIKEYRNGSNKKLEPLRPFPTLS